MRVCNEDLVVVKAFGWYVLFCAYSEFRQIQRPLPICSRSRHLSTFQILFSVAVGSCACQSILAQAMDSDQTFLRFGIRYFPPYLATDACRSKPRRTFSKTFASGVAPSASPSILEPRPANGRRSTLRLPTYLMPR